MQHVSSTISDCLAGKEKIWNIKIAENTAQDNFSFIDGPDIDVLVLNTKSAKPR